MPFKYKAYTADKKVVQGTIEVSSESLAEGALYNAGYQYILSLQEIPPVMNLKRMVPTLFGVKNQDVIDFSNQLATLVESGITILTSLKLLRDRLQNQPLKTSSTL